MAACTQIFRARAAALSPLARLRGDAPLPGGHQQVRGPEFRRYLVT